MNKFFIKLDRISAWVLFASMLIYFISGYGMTKEIISASFAGKLHLDILPIIIILAFTFHTAYATRLAFIRWNWWNVAMKIVWGLFYLVFLLTFLYIEMFYQPQTTLGTPTTESEQAVPDKTQNLSTGEKTFTISELAQYDGQNGQPAYVAVDSVVYDLSTVFESGVHFSHYAGKELTNAFYSRHVKSQITKYPVVGTLVK